eukprot:9368871-Heterocapsa_arctica.AAC.1
MAGGDWNRTPEMIAESGATEPVGGFKLATHQLASRGGEAASASRELEAGHACTPEQLARCS